MVRYIHFSIPVLIAYKPKFEYFVCVVGIIVDLFKILYISLHPFVVKKNNNFYLKGKMGLVIITF